jgi:hypothetical protein
MNILKYVIGIGAGAIIGGIIGYIGSCTGKG